MVSPAIVRRLVQGNSPDGPTHELSIREELTPRDEDLLRLLVHGYSNREIAETLFLGPQTVRNYVSSLYDKLGVRNRAEAMRFGRRLIASRIR